MPKSGGIIIGHGIRSGICVIVTIEAYKIYKFVDLLCPFITARAPLLTFRAPPSTVYLYPLESRVLRGEIPLQIWDVAHIR